MVAVTDMLGMTIHFVAGPLRLPAFPIYMHYRWVQWKVALIGMSEEEEDAAFEELHDVRSARHCTSTSGEWANCAVPFVACVVAEVRTSC